MPRKGAYIPAISQKKASGAAGLITPPGPRPCLFRSRVPANGKNGFYSSLLCIRIREKIQ
jgi:hypothetical protein